MAIVYYNGVFYYSEFYYNGVRLYIDVAWFLSFLNLTPPLIVDRISPKFHRLFSQSQFMGISQNLPFCRQKKSAIVEFLGKEKILIFSLLQENPSRAFCHWVLLLWPLFLVYSFFQFRESKQNSSMIFKNIFDKNLRSTY